MKDSSFPDTSLCNWTFTRHLFNAHVATGSDGNTRIGMKNKVGMRRLVTVSLNLGEYLFVGLFGISVGDRRAQFLRGTAKELRELALEKEGNHTHYHAKPYEEQTENITTEMFTVEQHHGTEKDAHIAGIGRMYRLALVMQNAVREIPHFVPVAGDTVGKVNILAIHEKALVKQPYLIKDAATEYHEGSCQHVHTVRRVGIKIAQMVTAKDT